MTKTKTNPAAESMTVITNNPYVPWLAEIDEVRDEVIGERAIKTFRFSFCDEEVQHQFTFIPGQCVMVSALGEGECMFALSSSPTEKDYLEVSVMKLGTVTSAFHQYEPGDIIGVRGPYGNGFDVKGWKGKNIITVGGGIGQPPLRSLIRYILDNRKEYGKLDIVYGARTSNDLSFLKEFLDLEKRDDVDVHLSIDVEEDGWTRFVGFVPDNLLAVAPSAENAVAITCGPPVMIHFVIQNLLKLGFTDEQIYTTLEMRMKCGIGKCGRCNIGNVYVCKDGPVFSYAQLKKMKGER